MNFIYDIFSYLMKGCLYISGNHYIIALFFFALAMQIVLLPLAIKQHRSQIKMAQVKPKEMAIREKYKGRNDRATQQKMTMEIQEMYQQNGYSQFSGCLPLLIQLPIILILFTIVRQPITYGARLPSENEKFNKDYYEQAVVFYQEQKEALDINAFANEQEYWDYVNKIETYQTSLGVNAPKEGEEQQKITVNGKELNVYTFSAENNERFKGVDAEIVLNRLINDGRETTQKLIDEKKISLELNPEFSLAIFDELDQYQDKTPNYRIGSLDFSEEPDFKDNIWLMIIPLLVFLTSFFSTKLTRRFGASANQTDANGNPVGGGLFMEVGMPLISAIFAYSFSAAIGAYWVWRTVISMGQTVLFAKLMPIPKVTEEDIAAAKKEMKANQKKKKVITIEVDEDDTSYDDMIVEGNTTKKVKEIDPTQRKPRRIEMLTADEDEPAKAEPAEESENESESGENDN